MPSFWAEWGPVLAAEVITSTTMGTCGRVEFLVARDYRELQVQNTPPSVPLASNLLFGAFRTIRHPHSLRLRCLYGLRARKLTAVFVYSFATLSSISEFTVHNMD